MSLADLRKLMAPLATSPDLFGEVVTYYPGGDQNQGRTIDAKVSRGEDQDRVELAELVLPELMLFVEDHATRGITAHDAADTVLVAVKPGETPRVVGVPRVIQRVPGGWWLEATP